MATAFSFATCSNTDALFRICNKNKLKRKEFLCPAEKAAVSAKSGWMSHRCLKVLICDVFEVDDDIVIRPENSSLQGFSCHLQQDTQ